MKPSAGPSGVNTGMALSTSKGASPEKTPETGKAGLAPLPSSFNSIGGGTFDFAEPSKMLT